MKKWIEETTNPEQRNWEEMYRNRFAHDKRVRTTHGVNCTGGCSWEIFVKDGIVTWELQALDYPHFNKSLPPYEPRGCPRGASTSWYQYSPLRVKHPYARGILIDEWHEARKTHMDPVEAWTAIMSDPQKRRRIQQARGKGGLVRISWEEALEINSASIIYTIKTYGPDRIAGFTPIPAMSQVSYASGVRFLSLIGGVIMSFYDWYADLPPASPETWGEQTDVHESAAWFQARFIACLGSNVNQTRSPDAHFLVEARHAGAKVTVFSPDFSNTSKDADWWIPVTSGQDAAFWLAVDHVIINEFYAQRQVPYFQQYVKQYTDLPFLVEVKDGRPAQYLRAARLERYKDAENGDWKLLIWDKSAGAPRSPRGSVGHRWEKKEKGRWNLNLNDGENGETLDPELTFVEAHDEVLQVTFDDFSSGEMVQRSVPVRYVDTISGRVAVTTVFDLLSANLGVERGLPSDNLDQDEENKPHPPAWQEKYTGIHRNTVIRFAREWVENAEKTGGKNLIIIGNGVNHWYHTDLIYRAAISALMLTGSVGVEGGGLAHYVGQEKVGPVASWASIAFAEDWGMVPRQQNTTSFHYIHSDQWRYDRGYAAYDHKQGESQRHTAEHTADLQARAVRLGWLPFYPQFDANPIDVLGQNGTGSNSPDKLAQAAQQIASGDLNLSVNDPDKPENWPRIWMIWRSNALGSAAKGYEYFLKHYLGTHHNVDATERATEHLKDVVYREEAPEGKLDLVVTLDFRMSSSALYSDIILPAATWYEKDDLNTTDLHSFLHPMQEAVSPSWEAQSDWNVFQALAKKVSEYAKVHLPNPVDDLVLKPLAHDTPDELAQPEILDWKKGETSFIPGKTGPKLIPVKRDYSKIYEKLVSLGKGIAENGVKAHGLAIPVADEYRKLLDLKPRKFDGNPEETYPSLEQARDVADAILRLDPISNGELAYRGFQIEEEKTGVQLADLAEGAREVRYSFDDIVSQPRRILTTPTWSGIVNNGRAYSPYTVNVERLVPWRTLTGRQQFYLDHSEFIEFGENLPVYKPRPDHTMVDETQTTEGKAEGRLFAYHTPHGKWGIHSTFSENEIMMTLSRGDFPIWINEKEAAEMSIRDNDWVEVYNDNGVFVQRCITSSRIPRGFVYVYHATERTVGIPKSPLTKRRAGIHNSPIRIRLKPTLMSGGYGQFTYAFNYWGPTGTNRESFVFVRRLDKVEF
ncbi:MAG TPA: nitrate reductase subunit alpha [Bellilinea sp.]|nr:nitrate reductase subunit alpha [Bellilinea sp.]